MRYDISLEGWTYESIGLLESVGKGMLPMGWSTAVQDGVWVRKFTFPAISSGSYSVKYRALVPGLILEKLVVDFGGLQPSYLGPLPSTSIQSLEA